MIRALEVAAGVWAVLGFAAFVFLLPSFVELWNDRADPKRIIIATAVSTGLMLILLGPVGVWWVVDQKDEEQS